MPLLEGLVFAVGFVKAPARSNVSNDHSKCRKVQHRKKSLSHRPSHRMARAHIPPATLLKLSKRGLSDILPAELRAAGLMVPESPRPTPFVVCAEYIALSARRNEVMPLSLPQCGRIARRSARLRKGCRWRMVQLHMRCIYSFKRRKDGDRACDRTVIGLRSTDWRLGLSGERYY
jgi:hypothetical protein